MKLERLIAILVILLNESPVTAKTLSTRFNVSVRTIQRDIDILSVAGIPVLASKGPTGGYSLIDTYTMDKTYLKKDEMKLFMDLLNGMEKLLGQAGFSGIREKIKAVGGRENYLYPEKLRFDFMPWLPQKVLSERFVRIFDAISSHTLVEIDYRDQKGNITQRRVEPYQLVMKDYAWYMYGYCLKRNGFRYFKVIRINGFKAMKTVFEPRPVPVEEPFAGLKDKLINIKLRFDISESGRLEDFFSEADIRYMGDHIIVETLYPDDSWLYQTLLSFGKNVEVMEPVHIRKKLKDEAQEILCRYS